MLRRSWARMQSSQSTGQSSFLQMFSKRSKKVNRRKFLGWWCCWAYKPLPQLFAELILPSETECISPCSLMFVSLAIYLNIVPWLLYKAVAHARSVAGYFSLCQNYCPPSTLSWQEALSRLMLHEVIVVDLSTNKAAGADGDSCWLLHCLWLYGRFHE